MNRSRKVKEEGIKRKKRNRPGKNRNRKVEKYRRFVWVGLPLKLLLVKLGWIEFEHVKYFLT